MNSFYKNKRKKGYSLAEVLVTVTILLILMAIAVPSVFTIRKNLRQKALDNKAELIYTAVQNNLVKLQNNGNSSVYAGDRATRVEENPSDADGDKSSILYYVTSDKKEDTGNAASVLVTKDTIDDELYSHYWAIEYNPDSASVYAVFYSETRDNYNISTYNSLRYKKNRLKDGAQVGYYGGDMILSGSTSILEPTLTVTNEEKLVATISCKRPDMNDLSFEVTLEDGEGHSLTLKYKPSGTMLVHQTDDLYWDGAKTGENEVGTVRGIRYELILTLDDLSKEELRFNKLYGPGNTEKIKEPNKGLTPGSTLKINVTVKSSGMFADEAEVSAVTNSLFADNTTENKAYVKYGRHLQNLDKASGITDKITSAVQQSDIHFEKQNDLDASTEDTTSWYSCYADKPFTPITNDNLKEFTSCFSDGMSGSTPVIYHLTVQNQKNAGLFAALADNMTVDSVRLSGAKISGSGDDSTAGSIAGETKGAATIKNCQVFLSNEDVAGKTEKYYWITGAAVQGGLIGTTNGAVSIEKSFAATVMGSEDAADVGGLVGVAKGEIAVTNSYSDSYLTGNRTGGILASSPDGKSVNITSCYTAGYQMPKTAGGGMAANITGDTDATIVSDCYTAVTWPLSSENSGESQSEKITIYSLSPGNAINSYFLNGGTDYYDPSGFEPEKGTKIDYKTLSDRTRMATKLGGAFTGSVISTNAYNLKNQGLTGYSYPALKGMPHYGDWEANFEPGSLVYYEVYREDDNSVSYGVYGGNMTSTLSDNKTIVGDGYGIAYEADSAEIPQEGITITYQTKDDSGSERIAVAGEDAKKYSVSVDNKTYVVFPLPAKIINAESIPGSYYQKLSIHSETITGENAEENTGSSGDANLAGVFYYNPHFAKTAVNASEAPKVQPEISIRTARQLYHLSLYYPDYAEEVKNSAFVQEVNIDYSAYRWIDYADKEAPVSVQEPIGVKGTKIIPFTSIYNGNYHEIRGVSFSTAATAVGFIGNNSKTVQNVFLVSDYSADGPNPYLEYRGTIGANRTVYMGALAGMNSGRIQNCAVSGYTMSTAQKIFVRSNGTFYFGGLTGSNSGLIMNCEADTPLIKAEILYGYAYLAGFAGENTAGGRIRNSYAIGHIMVENAKGGKTVISGFTARNAGYLSGDYCAVALTASGEKTTSYGFSPRSNVSNCSYLSGGTFHYLGKLYAFDNESGSGTKKTYKEMAVESTVSSHCHSATGTDVSYPFKTVVTDANGNAVHYGNWETMADLGAIGVIYWEHEQGGSNDGYHFSYIGYKANTESPNDTLDRISGSTLCTQHDDGGIIKEYGYGYYYASTDESELNEEIALGAGTPIKTTFGFQTGDINSEVSKALSNRLNGFTVVAYTTKPSIDGTAKPGSYMQMIATNREVINGVWQFTYQNLEYTFTINPFFANAMQYNGVPKSLKVRENGAVVEVDTTYPMPGSEGCQYQIRSADQLQYMNWNCKTGNAVTMIIGNAQYDQWANVKSVTVDNGLVESYTYLGYMYQNTKPGTAPYCWQQTHDVDANMEPEANGDLFIPIGSLYDANAYRSTEDADAYMAYLNGKYNGNTYSIKNIEINSDGASIGLFGCIIGADVSNVILYSDKRNCIQRKADTESSLKTWYVMGGMCGLAAVGKGNSAGSVSITNCTVSGYIIRDNSRKSAWGDACIGGMFGMSTMDLKKCTAVNDIELNTDYMNGVKSDGVSVRVGGLVGSMRGNVSNCYTGGEISCTPTCIENAGKSYGSKLFLGGITGGIYIKKGNFLTLLGDTVKGVTDFHSDTNGSDNTKQCDTATTFIYNCYSYTKMPIPKNDAEKKKYKSIEPIGSNGETPFENNRNYHVKVLIRNCYYYDANMPMERVRPEFRVCDFIGAHQNSKRDWTNIDSNARAISWQQLAGQELIDGKTLTALLGEIPQEAQALGLTNDRTFSAVTTMENGQNVDGKYSFPGTRTDLDGENYPFPTILKQGESIYVHYGEWPREGIYWEESRANMDIFGNLQLDVENDNDGWAVKTFKLLDPKSVLSQNLSTNEFNVTYSNGEENTTVASFVSNDEEIAAAFLDGTDFSENVDTDGFSSGAETASATASAETQDEEPGTVLLTGNDRIAEIIDISYDTNENGYIATVKALKTGATIITVSVEGTDNKEYSASFNLSVSAELSVYAEPEILELGINDSKDVTVHAVPSASLSVNGTEETVNVEEQNAASGWIIDSTSVDMITDEEFYTEVFAAGAVQFLQKDLASRMTWTVESDDPYIIECTKISADSKFTVKCHGASDSPVTLTVKGSYSYNGIDYSGVTWVEVKITGDTGIRWENDTESVILSGTSATKIFKLEDKSECLASEPDLNSFSVEPYSEQLTNTDEGTIVQGEAEQYVTVTKVEKTAGGYNVTMEITSPGAYKITVSAKGKDGKDYTAAFILTASDSSELGQAGDTDEIISSNTSQEDFGFISDDIDNLDDQNGTYVDMIPYQNSDVFSDEGSGWES